MVNISIIVPVYNSELYLEECLDSLVRQTLPDIEIICVDDSSTDNSVFIIEKYIHDFLNIHLVRHAHNKGLSEARNSGIRAATGNYIMFVDSDDYILPDTCGRLLAIADEKKTDIVYYAYKRLEKDGRFTNVYNSNDASVRRGKELFCISSEEERNRVEAWAQFYRKSFLDSNELFFVPNLIHEDQLFYFYSAMAAERVVEINDPLYVYRQHDGSIMQGAVTELKVKSYYLIVLRIFEYWLCGSFTDRENDAIIRFLLPKIKCFHNMKKIAVSDEKKMEMRFPEQFMYQVLSGNYNTGIIELSPLQVRRLRSAGTVVLYGAGAAAVDIIDSLEKAGISIDMVVVSKINEEKKIGDKPIHEISDLINDPQFRDAFFVIATKEKLHNEIETSLRKYGFNNIIKPKDALC